MLLAAAILIFHGNESMAARVARGVIRGRSQSDRADDLVRGVERSELRANASLVKSTPATAHRMQHSLHVRRGSAYSTHAKRPSKC